MRLQNFLLEDKDGRSTPIDKAKFEKLIVSDYSDSFKAIKKNVRYFRGSRTTAGAFLYVDPKKFKRSSRENQNYYTLIMSYDPAWAKYPPRDRCLIASTNYTTALNYGRVYNILPKNESIIGVAPKGDIWSSFKKTLHGDLLSFLDALEDAFSDAGLAREANQTIAGLKKACKNAVISPTDLESISYVPFDKKEGLYKWFVKNLSPEANGFRTVKAGEPHRGSDDTEVWTDGECLVVNYADLEKYL